MKRKNVPQYPHGYNTVEGKKVEKPSKHGGAGPLAAKPFSGDWPEFKYHHKR